MTTACSTAPRQCSVRSGCQEERDSVRPEFGSSSVVSFRTPRRSSEKQNATRNRYQQLEGCIVLNEHNTVFARSGPLYATGVSLGPPVSPESSTQTASRSLQPFLQVSLGDRPTDHATRLVTIGGAHCGEAKLCYGLRLRGVSLGPPESLTQTASRSLQPFLPS